MRCLILYASLTKNTERVALRIQDVLRAEGLNVELIKVGHETEIDLYQYDLIFLGSPVQLWLPTQTMMDLVRRTVFHYQKTGDLVPCSPVRPGKYAICFCTYAGPHTGVSEAVPAVKWIRTFFEHLGFVVLDEWYTVGEFTGSEENSTKGRLGDIRGRPNEDDLLAIEDKTKGILEALKLFR